jgi:hypothetical protein
VADWYVSSASYAAIAAFVPSAVYSIGNIVKPTAPALKAQWAFRCTTAGTASTEPAWPTANKSTVTTGGATFTNVTGQSTFGWSAAAGDIPTLIGAVGTFRFAAGDRMFVSSDHSETQTATVTYGSGTASVAFGVGQVLSVNRAGSTPPVAADLTAGATVTVTTGVMTLEATFPVYHYGMHYTYTGATANAILFNSSGLKTHWLDTCQLYLNTATAGCHYASGGGVTVVLNNSTVQFGATGQTILATTGPFEIVWLNTTSAIAGATLPTNLFAVSTASQAMTVTARGVDLSAVTNTLVLGTSGAGSKFLFDSCRIASGVTRYNGTGVLNTRDLVELVNCYDGTNFVSESYQPSGAVTTEFTITLSGGAADNVGTYSHKMVSNTNVDKYANPLVGFWMDANYATTGSSKTATVEIISSGTLNNDEISLIVEYLGTAGSSLASIATSLPANVLTTAGAVTTSTATWNSSPATPVKQHLQVTFTPQTAGRVRAQVRLGKASTTVYVNPQVTIT